MSETTAAAPRRMTREGRREALLAAAARVLHRHSLAELSFELVADEAGVSKTLPYTYFASPAEIAVSLFESVIGRIDRETDEVVASVPGFEARLRATLELWCDAIEADGRVVHALLDGRSVPAVRPLIDERDRAAVALWREQVVDELGLSAEDATFVATMVTAGATAILQLWVREGRARQEYVDRFVVAVRSLAEGFAGRTAPGGG